MNRSSEDIEREVEATRSDLDRTVEALKDKMTPGQMLDELTRSFKGTGASSAASDMVHNLGTQVRDNPLPLALIGLGVAWLAVGKGPGGSAQAASAYPTTYSGPTGVSGDTSSSSSSGGLAEKASGAAEAVKSGLSHLADGVSRGKEGLASATSHAGDLGHGLADSASDAAHRGAEYGRQAQRTFMDILEKEPLVVGALGFAVGAAIGATLPATEVEDRTMGKLRDRVLEKGKEQAGQQVAGVKQAAAAAVDAVRSEADSSSEGSLMERADRAVRAGVDAAKSEIEQQKSH